MCGIFGYLSRTILTPELLDLLYKCGMLIQHRGPDSTKTYESLHNYLMFHRLSINGLDELSNQPMRLNKYSNTVLVCNGEIYNYKELAKKYSIELETHSDCEIIIHLYHKLGIDKTLEELDGVFAFCLLNNNNYIIARDRIGVRSLYYHYDYINKAFGFSSELKALYPIVKNKIYQFPPGYYYNSEINGFKCYYSKKHIYQYKNAAILSKTMDEYYINIRNLLIKEVEKRLMSDREIGCLLSGGLDSSLIASILQRFLHAKGKCLRTFSIGFSESEDIKNARIVAKYIGSEHKELIIEEKELLDFIPEAVWQLETYDTTTIRAGTPMLYLCRWIKENTDIAVIFSGEGSDEASGSYMYFHNAPTDIEFFNEKVRLIEDLYYFDVLRCDKSTAGAGLEVRVPFLGKEFMEYYMNIPAGLKQPKEFKGKSYEKYLLRQAFALDGYKWLPESILWRTKDGMSDGVSRKERTWYQIIGELANIKYTNADLKSCIGKYQLNTPKLKETLWYRELYERYYSGTSDSIPYYWMPKWSGNTDDPSGRIVAKSKGIDM